MAGKWAVISHSPYLVVKRLFSMYQNLADISHMQMAQLTTFDPPFHSYVMEKVACR